MGAPLSGHLLTGLPASGPLVAREAELGVIGELVRRRDQRASALVLSGEPGVGKTSLWERGVALGAEHGLRVLTARASGAETGLPFAALIDLFDGVLDEELASLPRPQLRALNVALYREEPSGPSEPQGIALGLLSALRALAARDPLLVAVDDLQWLDRASEEVLAYAVRRLDPEPVTFLLARRPGRDTPVEKAFHAGRVAHLAVGPTSLGATRHILAERLGLRLTHHLLRRVYDTTLGNPLFTLEVGRMLVGRELEGMSEDVPVPDNVEDLLGMRVTDLDPSARRALTALALDSDLSVPEVNALAGPDAVVSAEREGVLVADGGRVRAGHPLLAAAAKSQATTSEREDLHRALADVITDEQRRALHLALATLTQDDELGARVAAAAEAAAARGATLKAVELATHAVRLTPPSSSDRTSRVLRLAQHLATAGEKQRVTDLLTDEVETFPRGAPRVAAYLLLTSGVVRNNDDIRRLMQTALDEAGDDDELRGEVLAELAENQAVVEVVGIAQADAQAAEALGLSGPDRPDHRRTALYTLAWTRALGGRPIRDVSEEYHAVSEDRFHLAHDPDRVDGQRAVWRGEVSRARELIMSLLTLAEERAEPSSYALQRLHLCELALRIGDWHLADRLLEEWGNSADSKLLHWPMYERCRALLAAGRGDVAAARQWGADALARAETTGVRWDWLEAKRALGIASLLAKDPERAARELGAVWEHTERHGVLDPGAFPAAPDLVEALVEVGAVEDARAVTDRLADLAGSQEHPWASAGAQRCSAVLQLATGEYDEQCSAALEATAARYQQLGLAFDHARTLLALGRAQRRAKKWGAARETLARAADTFASIGSSGWEADVRAELARVGAGRPTHNGVLTPTERRVAELAVGGMSNKEIARALVVTVNTVEFHLRNTYAKLGVRSRVQLVDHVAEVAEEDADPRP
jgi:DNA-binding NarL/FixJ family response regulator